MRAGRGGGGATCHGQAAAAAPALVLAQLTLQLRPGAAGSDSGGREVRVTKLPVGEGRGRDHTLRLEMEGKERKGK